MAILLATILAGLLLPYATLARNINRQPLNGYYVTAFCWRQPNYFHNRNVISGAPWTSTNMTADNCASYCRDPANGGPFDWMGVTDGNKCYCGNAVYPDQKAIEPEDCEIPCTGDSTYTCGGAGTLELYTRHVDRVAPTILDVPDQGLYSAGCYNVTDIRQYQYDLTEIIFESSFSCASLCRFDLASGDYRPEFAAFSLGEARAGDPFQACGCYTPIDWTKLKQIPLSRCNAACGLGKVNGNIGEYCGGKGGAVLLWSNTTRQDFDNASKATSLSTWSSSIRAASSSRYTARSSASSSKSLAASSRSSAATRVSTSKASASSSRSTARSQVNSSKSAASTSRDTARSSASASQTSASSSRSSARSRVSLSQSSASLSRSSRRNSSSASKSSYLSRSTYSSQSRASSSSAVSASKASAAASRSRARSVFSSSSLSRVSSLVSNTARVTSSRASASSSRRSANLAHASSWTSASRSLSAYYSSKSYSAYLVSSSKSAAKSQGGGARYGNYQEVVEINTIVTVDTSSSELPFTKTAAEITPTDNYDAEMTS